MEAKIIDSTVVEIGSLWYAIGQTERGHVELAHGLVRPDGKIDWQLSGGEVVKD